jgi:hypothetical protein
MATQQIAAMATGLLDRYLSLKEKNDNMEIKEFALLLGITNLEEFRQTTIKMLIGQSLTSAEIESVKNGQSVAKQIMLPSGRVISGTINRL